MRPPCPAVASDGLAALVDAETLERLRQPSAGRRLTVQGLEVGTFGVLDVTVTQVAPPRAFRRRNGTEGLVARATLGDPTGEVDLVLWDDEVRLLRDGTLAPGARLRLRGATVKAGYRGGIELGLGAAVVEPAPATDQAMDIAGTLLAVSETRMVADRFQVDVTLDSDGGPVLVVLWDDLVKAVRALELGAAIRLQGVARHPMLDGCYLGDGAVLQAVGAASTVPIREPVSTSKA